MQNDNVKCMDHLICQNAQLHTSKICTHMLQQCAIFVVYHANARTTGIHEAIAWRPCFTASR
jgi:hypothetical protein